MCSTTGSYNYEIESNNINYTIPDKINIFVNENSKTADLNVEVNFEKRTKSRKYRASF